MNELAKKLCDYPVENEKDLVNRAQEINLILKALSVYQGKIIGITGERGIGKTSVLNIIAKKTNAVKIRVYQRDNVVTILHDLIYELGKKLGKKYDELLKKWEIGYFLSIQPGVELKKTKADIPVRELVEKLRKALDKEGELILIIDELDKERYEELVRIMDAIKYAFEGKNTTVIMSLPPMLEREYITAVTEGTVVENVEGFLSLVIPLSPLSEKDLVEILKRRLGKDFKKIDKKALELALLFARGNPRRLLKILHESILFAREKLDESSVKAAVTKYLKAYLSARMPSAKELQILKLAYLYGEDFIKKAVEEGIVPRKANAYTYLRRLQEKELMINRHLHPLVKLAFMLKII